MCCFVGSIFWYTGKDSYRTEDVLESVWNKYNVKSTQIGETDPVIWIDVYDEKDIPEVEEYLQNHLSKEDRSKYEISVFSNKGIEY